MLSCSTNWENINSRGISLATTTAFPYCNSGEVKNKAAIARKFGVSRAWVTKVLSS